MHHTAFGKDISHLDVVLVEHSKPTQAIMRGILGSLQLGRVRIYDNPKDALPILISDPPDLVLSSWEMRPVSGYQLLKLMRSGRVPELINVPLIFITAYGTRALVTRAMEAGAHHLLVTPISAQTLRRCLEQVATDRRRFIRDDDGSYVLEGTRRLIEENRKRFAALDKAKEIQREEEAARRAKMSAGDEDPLSLEDLQNESLPGQGLGKPKNESVYDPAPYQSRRPKS